MSDGPVAPVLVLVASRETHALRGSVLRPGRPLAECAFEGDDAPDTVHFAVKISGEIVGIASLYGEPFPGASGRPAFRLRGMATSPAVRGSGHGKALVRACLAHVARAGGGIFWCNARTTAAAFYESLGLVVSGPPFDLPGIGPHVRMLCDVPAFDLPRDP